MQCYRSSLGYLATDQVRVRMTIVATPVYTHIYQLRLRILQSTVIGKMIIARTIMLSATNPNSSGVIVLHLLFVQGASFLFGGIQLQGQGQALRTHQTDMNRSLLTIGCVFNLLCREIH